MELPLKIEVKRESIDIEENDLEFVDPGMNLKPIYTNLEPAVFTDISNCVSKDKPNLRAIKIFLKSDWTLKESNKVKKSSKSSKKEKLREKEASLKIKESILAMKEASIKCKENILEIKEANLRMREDKLIKKESKVKSKESIPQIEVSEEKKSRNHCKPDKEEKPEPITKSTQQCNICNKTLKYKTWITHMREVHSPTTYVCYCKRFFHARRLYERHVQHVHNGVKRYSLTQRPKTENKCTKCDVVFDHPYPLKTHMRNVHSGEGKEIRCELCDSKVRSQSYLRSHMQRVHYDDGKMHMCKICDKKFNSPRSVVIHIRNSHVKHGLKVQSPKKHVKSEEKEDWNIENKTRAKCTKECKEKRIHDWEIQNENIDSNSMERTHEVKIELDEDVRGYYLKEVLLSPQHNCHVELREVKLENM